MNFESAIIKIRVKDSRTINKCNICFISELIRVSKKILKHYDFRVCDQKIECPNQTVN